MKKVYEKNVGEDARGEALYTRVHCKRQACRKMFTPVGARHVFCSEECSRAPFAPARKFCRRTECFAKLTTEASEFCTPECESKHNTRKPHPTTKRQALERKRIREAFAVAAASNEAAEPEVADLPPDVHSGAEPSPWPGTAKVADPKPDEDGGIAATLAKLRDAPPPTIESDGAAADIERKPRGGLMRWPFDVLWPDPQPAPYRVHVSGMAIDCRTLDDLDALVKRYGEKTA